MTEKLQNNKRNLIIIGILLVIGFLLLFSSRDNTVQTVEDVQEDATSALEVDSTTEDTETESNIDSDTAEDMSQDLSEYTPQLPALNPENFTEKGGDIAELSNISDLPPPDPSTAPQPESTALSPDEYPELYSGNTQSAVSVSDIGVLLNELQSLQEGISVLLDNDTSAIQDDLPLLINSLEKLLEDLDSYVAQLEVIESEQ